MPVVVRGSDELRDVFGPQVAMVFHNFLPRMRFPFRGLFGNALVGGLRGCGLSLFLL